MKKNFFYAMMSAIALTSAVSFTGCASDDGATVENNPTYDGSNVRTDFAFSISSGKMGGTRMTGVNTLQADNSFLGMKNLYLLSFEAGVDNAPTITSTTNTGKSFSLGTLTGITSTQSSKVYSLQLPVGTDNFLFYGTVDNSSVTERIKRGALTSTLTPATSKTEDISFSLVPISESLGADATKLASYLSNIAKVKITWDDDNDASTAPVDLNWYDAPTKAQTDGAYTTLATLYNNFTSINDFRSGSAESILRTVLDMYRTAKGVIMVGNPSDGNVYKIANAICTAIENGDGTGYSVTITPETPNNPNTWTAAWNGLTNTNFPHNLKLPMGAAQLEYNTTSHTFSYKTSPNYAVYGDPEETVSRVALGSISYPAELIYFDNSPLRATDSYKQVSDYPKEVAKWDKIDQGEGTFSSDWSGNRVEPSTRAVAMRNNVNYGVALLETKIQMAAGIAQNMEDNMQGLNPSASSNQTDIDGTKFEVTGILIGGQPASVGWDMTNPGLKVLPDPTDNGREVFNNVIYDQDIPFNTPNVETNTPIPVGSYSNSIYTLVLDNYTTDANGQKPVRIALELVNKSGKDFYGKEGIIPNGHTFYLCAELNPATEAASWQTATRAGSADPETNKYRVTAETTPRIFAQDYKTVANFTINPTSLQKAYSSIPDLRSTEVLFGLSVDLKWEAGMTFDVNIQ